MSVSLWRHVKVLVSLMTGVPQLTEQGLSYTHFKTCTLSKEGGVGLVTVGKVEDSAGEGVAGPLCMLQPRPIAGPRKEQAGV